jgi:hypothetical protein
MASRKAREGTGRVEVAKFAETSWRRCAGASG